MKSLGGKIVLLCCGIAAITSISIGLLNYWRVVEQTREAAIQRLGSEARLMASKFLNAYGDLANDTFFVSKTPPVSGIIRCQLNDGVDTLDDSSMSQWKHRLETTLISLMEHQVHYTQTRFIGLADNGREIVRVNRTPEGFERVAIDSLQKKDEEPYFQEALSLQPTEHYFSKVTYNREHGELDDVQVATLRSMVPVFSDQDTLFGFIVINVDYPQFLRDIINRIEPQKTLIVSNSSGDTLQYEPSSKEFEFLLGKRDAPADKPLPEGSESFELGDEYASYTVSLQEDETQNAHNTAISTLQPVAELLEDARKVRNDTILLSSALVLGSLVLSSFLAHALMKPLRSMTDTLSRPDSHQATHRLPTDREDEIGELATAFANLIGTLAKSEKTLKTYIEASGDSFWDWDLANEERADVVFLEMLGYSSKEAANLKLAWREVVDKDSLIQVELALKKHFESKGEYPYIQELKCSRKDGSKAYILARGSVVAWGDDEKPLRMMGTITDVSQVKEVASQLEWTKDQLSLVLDAAPDGIVSVDENGTILFVNPALERIFGYHKAELVGQGISMLIPPDHHARHGTHVSDYVKSGQSRIMASGRELYGLRKDGERIPVEVGLNRAVHSNGSVRVVAVVRDITIRRAADLERENLLKLLKKSNQELDDFAYVASHDLKAPLRVIDNASRWIEEDLEDHLDEDSRENMQLLRGRVMRMEKLLDDLLEYSRIGKKSDSRNSEVVNGDELIKEVTELLDLRNFNLTTTDSFDKILCYRLPLLQILYNLINNAIKHHDKESGNIEISAETNGEHYIISVKDDGPGIDAKFHERVFGLFQTLKPRDRVEGSGMGLSIVKKHIENAGCEISLNSSTNSGSEFRFTWPRYQPSSEN